MLKKIRKLYDDKSFVAALSVILMASPYPILSGWLLPRVGEFWSLVYLVVIVALMLIHGFIIVTKTFPRFYSDCNEDE